jgi:hypothetical protein
MGKALGEMSFAELSEELAAAQAQYQAAQFQERLRAMQSQQDAASERKAAVEAEIDRRFTGLSMPLRESAHGE